MIARNGRGGWTGVGGGGARRKEYDRPALRFALLALEAHGQEGADRGYLRSGATGMAEARGGGFDSGDDAGSRRGVTRREGAERSFLPQSKAFGLPMAGGAERGYPRPGTTGMEAARRMVMSSACSGEATHCSTAATMASRMASGRWPRLRSITSMMRWWPNCSP